MKKTTCDFCGVTIKPKTTMPPGLSVTFTGNQAHLTYDCCKTCAAKILSKIGKDADAVRWLEAEK